MEDSASALSFILSELPEGIPRLADDAFSLDQEVERRLGGASAAPDADASALQALAQGHPGMQLEESPIYSKPSPGVEASPAHPPLPTLPVRPAALEEPGAPLLALVPRLNERGLAREAGGNEGESSTSVSHSAPRQGGGTAGLITPLEQLLPAPGCASAGRLRSALSALAVAYRQLELCFEHAQAEVASARASAASEARRAVEAETDASESREALRFCRLTLAAHLPGGQASSNSGSRKQTNESNSDSGGEAAAEAAAAAVVEAARGPALAAATTQIAALASALGGREREIAVLKAHLRDLLAVASFPASAREDVEAAAALAVAGAPVDADGSASPSSSSLVRDVAVAALRSEVDRLNAEVVAAAVAAAARGREADARVAAADARVAAAEDSRRREAARCAEAEAAAEGLRTRLASAQAEAARAREGWSTACSRLSQAEEAIAVLVAEVRARDAALVEANERLAAARTAADVMGRSAMAQRVLQEAGVAAPLLPPAPVVVAADEDAAAPSHSPHAAQIAALLHGGAGGVSSSVITLAAAATSSPDEDNDEDDDSEDEEEDGEGGVVAAVLTAQRTEVLALRAQLAQLQEQLAAAQKTMPVLMQQPAQSASGGGRSAASPPSPPSPAPASALLSSPWLDDVPPLPPPTPEADRLPPRAVAAALAAAAPAPAPPAAAPAGTATPPRRRPGAADGGAEEDGWVPLPFSDAGTVVVPSVPHTPITTPRRKGRAAGAGSSSAGR